MNKVGKRILTEIIFKRMYQVVPQKTIYSAIEMICENLAYDLVEDSTVSVENFGTLSPYVFHGHKAGAVRGDGTVEIQPFRSVKLNPHADFEQLIQKKKSEFS